MVLVSNKLVKLVIALMLTIFAGEVKSQSRYEVTEKLKVKRCLRKFRALKQTELGLIKVLRFDLIGAVELQDSVILEATISACPYYELQDGEHPCNEQHQPLTMYVVKEKRKHQMKVGSAIRSGVYKVASKYAITEGANKKVMLRFKKLSEYVLVFESPGYEPIVVKINRHV